MTKLFDKYLNQKTPVVLLFTSGSCAKCPAVQRQLDKYMDGHKAEMAYAKIDLSEHREMFVDLGIQTVPTLMFLRDKKVFDTQVGMWTEAATFKTLDKFMAYKPK